uniref:EGF-like domain-containing protein n=1 Tax=Strongyloides papillosus TaxID=174720 RepID=A0A0N5CAJ2_STREA
MFCPNKFYDIYSSNLEIKPGEEDLYLNYDDPRVCSLKICEIGIYYRPYTQITQDGILNFEDKEAYYVVLSNTEEEKDIIFGTYLYDDHNYPLIPCPYTNWIPKNILTKFIPSNYVIENGIEFPYNDYDRHRFVPGIPSSKNGSILYCGKIYQPNFKEINVGVQLKLNRKNTTYNNIEVTTTGVKCSDNKTYSNNIFSYTPDNTNYYGNNRELKKFHPEIDRIYSGQMMLIYKEDNIRQMIGVIDHEEIRNEFFDNRKKVEPICSGIVPDKIATLHLKIDDEKISFKKTDSGIMLVKIDVKSRRNKMLHVGCHAVVDDASDNRYENFYLKRYKFVLFKGKLSNFNSSNNLDKINISSIMDPKNIYGYYSCGMDKDKKNSNIRESEFVLLPEKQVILIEPVTNISKANNSFFCYKNYMEIGDLSVIKIELHSGRELNNLDNPSSFAANESLIFDDYNDYNNGDLSVIKIELHSGRELNNLDNPSSFGANESLIIFDDYNDYNNGVMTLICEYHAFNEPFILLKRKFISDNIVLREIAINNNQSVSSNNTSNSSLSTLLITTIVAVSIIIITIIISVSVIICVKLKNKKKKMRNSSSSGSSRSFSSASRSASNSSSSILTSKNSRSKVKVPIILGSQSDSSISMRIGIYKNGSPPVTNNRYYPHVENDSYKDYKYNGKTLEEVLNAKKVYIIEIDISKFNYGHFEDDKKIILMFCPTKYYQTINSSLISEYEKRSLFLRYDKPRTCSLKICEIGIYYRPHTDNILNEILNSKEKDVFYVVINNKEKDIIFGTYVYDNHRYPLIPCPYTNWIPNINLTKFIPSNYVMENGIQFPDEYNDRHIFVPVIPSSNDNITLYCGKIYQPNFKEINVGVKLKFGSQSTSYDKIETTKTGVKCFDKEINPINYY